MFFIKSWPYQYCLTCRTFSSKFFHTRFLKKWLRLELSRHCWCILMYLFANIKAVFPNDSLRWWYWRSILIHTCWFAIFIKIILFFFVTAAYIFGFRNRFFLRKWWWWNQTFLGVKKRLLLCVGVWLYAESCSKLIFLHGDNWLHTKLWPGEAESNVWADCMIFY